MGNPNFPLADVCLFILASITFTMKEASKPVKTHLDKVNFLSELVKGYQYGVTVDPVGISSLKKVRL
jgi:hypothetical protein